MLAVDWFVAVFAFVLVCLFILLGVVCCVALAFWGGRLLIVLVFAFIGG